MLFSVANFHVIWRLLLLASRPIFEIFRQVDDIEVVTVEQGAAIGQHTEALSQLSAQFSDLKVKSCGHSTSVTMHEEQSRQHSEAIADLSQQVVCSDF